MPTFDTGLRLARRLIVLVGLILAPGIALAQQKITIPAEEFIKAAIAKQQYDVARQILETLLAKKPDDVEINFLMAQVEADQNHIDEAIERYRQILKDHPDLPRVRLELAQLLFIKKEDDAAEYHFRLVLAQRDLPKQVADNIQKFLDAIRARRDWLFDVSASLAPNTNINTGPSLSQVDIAGLPFSLSSQTTQQGGIGAVFTTSGEYDYPIDDTTKLRGGGYAFRAEYPGKYFDDLQTELYGGPQFIRQSWDISFLGVLDRRWYANDPYNVGYGPRVQFNWNATSRFRLETQVEFLKRDYRAETSFLNGYISDINLAGMYALDPVSYAKVILGGGYEHTQANFFANQFYRFGVGYHRDLTWGISVEDQPEIWRYDYQGPVPLFGETRHEWWVRNTFTIYKRDWHWMGFSPTFNYVFTDDMSNVPLFKFTQHQFIIGMTKQF